MKFSLFFAVGLIYSMGFSKWMGLIMWVGFIMTMKGTSFWSISVISAVSAVSAIRPFLLALGEVNKRAERS